MTAGGRSALVGIVANPASGKDIRRLVAHGSTVDNNEKINIVRRVLIGLEAAGAERVAYMPDTYGIVPRAASRASLGLDLAPLPMATLGVPADTFEAARRLTDAGAGAIVTLGGDGTNRLVAKGCGDVPLVPISTGTNNVFPRMVEGTLAGLAAGLVATGVADRAGDGHGVVRRLPRLEVLVDGEARDVALVDVATTRQQPIGARAIWNPRLVAEVVLSRVAPAEIGLASLGGLLFPEASGDRSGVHVVVGDATAARAVVAPLAPGLIASVPIAAATLIAPGDTVDLAPGPCTIALDGEREFELLGGDRSVAVRLDPAGPWVVDIPAALRAGAVAGVFLSLAPEASNPTGKPDNQ